MIHFEGDLLTEVDGNEIGFKKIGVEEKAKLIDSLHEIKLNHEYHMWYEA